jgi:DnaJ-class molecular chaperone
MARKPRDHYDALGVPRNADTEQIRKAYRKKAKEHHPDAGSGGDLSAFHAAQQAYEELKDPGRRRAYDEELRRREDPRPRREPGASRDSRGPGDPFSSPFGTDSGRPAGGGRRRSRPAGMDDLFREEDELFGRILNELFGGGPGPGRSAFGGFGDMFSDPSEGAPFGSPQGRGRHRHLRDEEPLSVVVHLSPDESYTGGTVSVDIGGGRSILASIPPGVRHGEVIRSEFYDAEGPRELKLHIRID